MATTAKKVTKATTKTGLSPVAKNGDLTALYNQAYPNASKANAGTLAKTKQNVDDMSVRDRLWDSYNMTYGQQREASDESFAKAYSKASNELTGRGMQRSSYGAQTLANVDQQKIKAQNDIYGQQIAAYEKALLDVEKQEQEQENWQKQFDESVRQFNLLHPQATGGEGGGGYGGGSGGRGGRPKSDPYAGLSGFQRAAKQIENSTGNKVASTLKGALQQGVKVGSVLGQYNSLFNKTSK